MCVRCGARAGWGVGGCGGWCVLPHTIVLHTILLPPSPPRHHHVQARCKYITTCTYSIALLMALFIAFAPLLLYGTVCIAVAPSTPGHGALVTIAHVLTYLGGVRFIAFRFVHVALRTKLARPPTSNRRLAVLVCLLLLPGCWSANTVIGSSPTEAGGKRTSRLLTTDVQQELVQLQERVRTSEARAQASEARAQASEAQARANEARAQASETRAQVCEARAQVCEARAQVCEVRAKTLRGVSKGPVQANKTLTLTTTEERNERAEAQAPLMHGGSELLQRKEDTPSPPSLPPPALPSPAPQQQLSSHLLPSVALSVERSLSGVLQSRALSLVVFTLIRGGKSAEDYEDYIHSRRCLRKAVSGSIQYDDVAFQEGNAPFDVQRAVQEEL